MNTIQRLRLLAASLLLFASASRAAQETVAYTYDDSGRLVTAAWSVGCSNAAAHYQYDANGNRTGTLNIAANDTSVDSNGDGMPDLGQLAYFGGLNVDGAADPDGDGLVNSNEMVLLGNPFQADTDDDAMTDAEEHIAGTALNDGRSFFSVTNISRVAGAMRVGWRTRAGRTYQVQTSGVPVTVWGDAGAPYECAADGSYFMDQPLGTTILHRARVKLTE